MRSPAAIFGLGVTVRNVLYDHGILRARRLRGAVISVGNLSVGGTGKTPFVLLLGELLLARGVKFDVLSRGYGRRGRGVAVVECDGTRDEFGDEPLLIARKLNVPVVVGKDRFEAGMFAEERFGPEMHLLDDGFQHRGLARDFDIVLLNTEDAQDRLLPSGRLREPLSSLRRADAVVLTNDVPRELFSTDGKLLWRVRRGIAAVDVPARPVAFCGIARPKDFMAQLRAAGISPVAEVIYRDHHAYGERDIADLRRAFERNNGNGFVTTEKDAINLGQLRSALEPLSVVPVMLELEDADNAVDTMFRVILERKRGHEKIAVQLR
jgi:tetraacyldisaccharide 4'-kinase